MYWPLLQIATQYLTNLSKLSKNNGNWGEPYLHFLPIFCQYKDTGRVSQLWWISMISEDNSNIKVLWTSCPAYFASVSLHILFPLKGSSFILPPKEINETILQGKQMLSIESK